MAVLDDIDTSRVDETVNLGDLVGYGPDPEKVVTILSARRISSVLGNHEQALFSRAHRLRLNPPTRKSIEITASLMSDATLKTIEDLPRTRVLSHGCRLVHGCPPDSVNAYLLNPSPGMLEKLFASFPERICFIGHTHNLALFGHSAGRQPFSLRPGRATISLDPASRYIINVGSVGQPRDPHGKDAKYVIWDTGSQTLEVRFVPYDSTITAGKIIELGFPKQNASRLL